MKKLLLISAILIFAFGFGQTPITDANFNQAIETCLSTNPIDGMCSDSEYGAMPDWDVSQVTNMSYAFNERFEFSGDISDWDVSSVTAMNYMFLDTSSFNQDISNWDVSNVISMSGMFRNSVFNQPIGNWDVSNVTSMYTMFQNSVFNHPIGNWDEGDVRFMDYMFADSNFNQPIGNWDVSGVSSHHPPTENEYCCYDGMRYMFSNSPFNQDISDWDVSSVTGMSFMFQNTPFNQDISNWDVGNVRMFGYMFENTPFNQDLSQWNIENLGWIESDFLTGIFDNSGLNYEYYDNIITSWSQQNILNNAPEWVTTLNYKTIGAEGVYYCNSEDARQVLINNGWTLNDAGPNCKTDWIPEEGFLQDAGDTNTHIWLEERDN